MAKEHELSEARLGRDQVISEGRNVWADLANEEGGCIRSCNIAEGQGRASKRDFRQFLAISRGSLLELETQLLIAEGLKFLSTESRKLLFVKTDELPRMLNGLMKSMD